VVPNYNKYQRKIDKDPANLFNLINTVVTNPSSGASLAPPKVMDEISIGKLALLRKKRFRGFDCPGRLS